MQIAMCDFIVGKFTSQWLLFDIKDQPMTIWIHSHKKKEKVCDSCTLLLPSPLEIFRNQYSPKNAHCCDAEEVETDHMTIAMTRDDGTRLWEN